MASPLANLEEVIERLEAATADAREVTREVHSAIKAARLAERDLLGSQQAVEEAAGKMMAERLNEIVEQGLNGFRDATDQATRLAHSRVDEAFDVHVNLLLYGNAQGRGTSVLERIQEQLILGESALQEMARQLADAKHLPPTIRPDLPALVPNTPRAPAPPGAKRGPRRGKPSPRDGA